MLTRDVPMQTRLSQVLRPARGTGVKTSSVIFPLVDGRGPPPVRQSVSTVGGRKSSFLTVPGHGRRIPAETAGKVSAVKTPWQ